MTDVKDVNWADLARSSREALALLGHPIGPRCLPDESDPCGATYAQHAGAHLATLRAVVDHHAAHLGSDYDPMLQEIYLHATAEFTHSGFCQGFPT